MSPHQVKMDGQTEIREVHRKDKKGSPRPQIYSAPIPPFPRGNMLPAEICWGLPQQSRPPPAHYDPILDPRKTRTLDRNNDAMPAQTSASELDMR